MQRLEARRRADRILRGGHVVQPHPLGGAQPAAVLQGIGRGALGAGDLRVPAGQPDPRVMAGGEIAALEVVQPLRLGQGRVEAAIDGPPHVGRDLRPDHGGEDRQRPHHLRLRPGEDAGDPIAEGMADDQGGGGAFRADAGGDIRRQIDQGDAGERPGRAIDPARLRAQHQEAGGGDQRGDLVVILPAAAERGEQHHRRAARCPRRPVDRQRDARRPGLDHAVFRHGSPPFAPSAV